MSSKNKGINKDKRNTYQSSCASFVLTQHYPAGGYYGHFFCPQWGGHQNRGEYIVYDECGLGILDPTLVQGSRIVKDIEVRACLFNSLNVENNYVVVLYKYNRAYTGVPCPDWNPTPNEKSYEDSYGYPTIPNYQSILATCVIEGGNKDEHIIKYDDEVILESGDEIRISFGNIARWGNVKLEIEPDPHFERELVSLNGDTILSGTAKCAIAYL